MFLSVELSYPLLTYVLATSTAGSLATSDLLNKLWGWDRLLAYDLGDEFQDPSDMPMYESYLEKFYASNHHHVKSAADAILQVITCPCLPTYQPP